ncbi:hypothetical protein DPMN_074090 [Dreissena polymorpha]|uniref:Nephrin n=1 Tax=Dreissena polymorpha TaxID=45954 RepID=A0A9D4BLB4_DREPO|nr:hypothetical protein DPMN_074090 [Dreissena polymorpha]
MERTSKFSSEGTTLTLSCTSPGGYPEHTVNWYRGTTSNAALPSGTPSVTESNGLYNVVRQVAFTPTGADDGVLYICQTFYQGYPQASQSSSVRLLLNLQPSKPNVILMGSPVDGSAESDIATCSTGGFRPSHISISWTFGNVDTVAASNLNPVNVSNKFSVTTNYKRAVVRADNGKELTCSVSHQTLSAALSTSVTVNILFRPLNATISGNREIVADGLNRLTLICTAGESNPVPDIVWYNGSSQLANDRPYNDTAGLQWNGKVRRQELWLNPTRYMNGDNIRCEVRNTVSSGPVMSGNATLNLRYRPIVSVEPSSSLTVREDPTATGTLTCTVDSSPPANISWYHGNLLISSAVPSDGRLVHTINPVTRQSYGTYTCKADNAIPSKDEQAVTLNVEFSPNSTVIDGNKVIVANGQNTLTLTCTAGNSNPVSSIHWTFASINSTQPSVSTESSSYGGRIARSVVTFTPSRNDDGKNVSCRANNTLNRPSSSSVMLDLKYRPEIYPILTQSTVEGNSHTLPCAAQSKPPATFSWYRKGELIHQTSGTSSFNQGPYTINRVNRSHAGIYTCKADNNVLNKDEQDVTLTVQYPPDITVVVQNTSIMTNESRLICNASGVPNTYTFNSTWSQDWPGHGKIRDWVGIDDTLTLNQLTYAHSGMYACSATNGIKVFGTDQQYMPGSGYLLVKDVPVITSPDETTPNRIASEINTNASIILQVYSNSGDVKVSVFKVLNGSRGQTSVGSVNMSSTYVHLPVFNRKFPIEGTLINISILMEQTEDFGLYEAIVSNAIGNRALRINVEAQGPPQPPHDVVIEEINDHSAVISWKHGFHGGFPQTFVIQTSFDGNSWKNATTVEGEMLMTVLRINATITGLEPATQYFVRMFSFNSKGASTLSENKNFTTFKELDKVSSESSSKAGVIAGSIVGGLVGLFVVVMTVVALRKYELIFNCKCVRKPESTEKVLYEASAVLAINNVEYESLGNRNDIRRDQPEINTRYNDNALGTNAYESLDANQSSKHVYSELGRQTGKGKTRPYENTAVNLDSGNAVYVNTTFENA